VQLFLHPPPGTTQAAIEAYVRPMVERAAFAISVNEAWAMLSAVAVVALALVWLLGKTTVERKS
jgi:DHA2 family multidrug resistance protein